MEQLIGSIVATIGVEHEIIAIDNSKGEYGICKAYNKGILQSKFDFICFVHEDVVFETSDWGRKAIDHLSEPEIGLIGVAGGSSKSLVPSSWAPFIVEAERSYFQHYKDDHRLPQLFSTSAYENKGAVRNEVVCIDGMWFCARKEVFQYSRFDEQNFPGFHGYDQDISLQIGRKFKVSVVFDILLHHYSEGVYDRKWMEACITLSRKWRSVLPAFAFSYSRFNSIRQHWTVMNIFVDYLQNLGYSRFHSLKLLFEFGIGRYFSIMPFLASIKKILLR